MGSCNVAITRFGDSVACSLLEEDEEEGAIEEVTLESNAVPTKSPVVLNSSSESSNVFKAGDSAMYKGEKVKVTRAYLYKGEPFCILSDKRQVSESKLTKK